MSQFITARHATGTAILGICLLLVNACNGSKYKLVGAQRLSEPTYDALANAVTALERANEYRDAGVLLYEPRFLDAERAVDAVRTAHGDQMADFHAATISSTCIMTLETYRLGVKRLSFEEEPHKIAEAEKDIRDAGHSVNACIAKVKEFL